MRILIASDLHANLEAVAALPKDYDELWVLGDLVNYGPNPSEVVDFVREHASTVVRGNHDQFAGSSDDPRCSEPFQQMAKEMGRFTVAALSPAQKRYLQELPLTLARRAGPKSFYLCHATPGDPLYDYCPPTSERWLNLLRKTSAAYLLVGHTHMQFQLPFGDRAVVNPGSVGQPKTGSPAACWAIFDGQEITLHSAPYDVDVTIKKLRQLEISPEVQTGLVAVLQTGTVPR